MRNLKIFTYIFLLSIFVISCGGGKSQQELYDESLNKGSIEITLKNAPSFAPGDTYTITVQVGSVQYSNTITDTSFDINIHDVQRGYTEITVLITLGGSPVVTGYASKYIVAGYNTVTVDFFAPQISHIPAETVLAGYSATITANITDDANAVSAYVYYSNTESNYSYAAMSKSGNTYTGVIPSAMTENDTIYYYIKATEPYHSQYFASAGMHSDTEFQPLAIAVLANPAPAISHTQTVTACTEYTSVEIAATITDTTQSVVSATLVYTNTAGGYETAMTNTIGDTYTTTITSSQVRTPTLTYYIRAYDGISYSYIGSTGQTASVPLNKFQITVNAAPYVDTTPPVILHTAVTSTSESYVIPLTAIVTDDTYVAYVYAKFKKYNAGSYTTAVLNNSSGNTWTGNMTFVSPNIDTTYYYLEASDGSNYSYYNAAGQVASSPTDNPIKIAYAVSQQPTQADAISFTTWTGPTFNPDTYSYLVDPDTTVPEDVSLGFSYEDDEVSTYMLLIQFLYFGVTDYPIPTGTYSINSGNIMASITFADPFNTNYWAANMVESGNGASGNVTVTYSSDTITQGTFDIIIVPSSLIPGNNATGSIQAEGTFSVPHGSGSSTTVSDSGTGDTFYFTNYNTTDGLINDYLKAIYQDTDGNMWFATFGGASKFNGTTWTDYTNVDGLPSPNTISQDTAGNMWFGTFDYGARKFNGSTWTSYHDYNGLANDWILSIIQDKNGNMWFGTAEGVSKYNGSSWTSYTNYNGLVNDFVICVYQDTIGNMWFGTLVGVSKFNGSTWTDYTESDGLADNYVYSIYQDTAENMWFSTRDNGVSKFNGTTWTTYNTADGLANNKVYSVIQDNNGNMWFGTDSNGISKFDGTAWSNYTTADGLSNDTVKAVFKDNNGNLWLGTDGGGVVKLTLKE